MQIERTPIEGVLVLTPARFGDNRGFFSESWNRRTLEKAGVTLPEFVQDNHSLSARAGTLRGLHYQAPPHAQGKLVRCGRGRLFDVAVDAREGIGTGISAADRATTMRLLADPAASAADQPGGYRAGA